MVSVIIPVYNTLRYLRESLESVIHQTYQNLEIIIVDDGSTDGSESICDEYKYDSRVRVIHQENRGLGGARNAGLDIMSGEIVAFLDSDDAFLPETIQTMVEAMLFYKADIVIFGFASHKTTGSMNNTRCISQCSFKEQKLLNTQAAIDQLVHDEISYAVWNKIYLRKIWNNIRFPENRVYEDVIVSHQLLNAAAKILMFPGVHLMHRIHLGSISQTKSKKNDLDRITACQELEAYVKENIPSIYNQFQLNMIEEQSIQVVIILWTHIPAADQERKNSFRKAIIEKGKCIPKHHWGIRTRLLYQIIRFCPYLFPVIIPFYRFIRYIK